MDHCKLQIGCLIILLYITFVYIRDIKAFKVQKTDKLFNVFIALGIFSVTMDAITAYTVNNLDKINYTLNLIMHMFFLISLDVMMFLVFVYILQITKGFPKNKKFWYLILAPLIINLIIVIVFLPELSFIHGKVTNYSMGISAYTCFFMVIIYIAMSVVVFRHSFKNLERKKQVSISTFLIVIAGVSGFQMIKPEALITCLVPTIVVLGAYLNQENPLYEKLKKYNNEMVMGFATLVENRDDNTGGHIYRTTEYVKLLAEELKKRKIYSDELTNDYINNLIMAAPMHDVGKIAIPDAILQKPGKLTDEEYTLMKTHAQRGGKIIKETFGHFGENQYEEIAYEVAVYHHEKWNGKGYPEGLSETQIPLCARIMAIADVFDAVSAKRCYRDAMPLEKCFGIIKSGKGQDFDPLITEVFLDMEDKITEVYKKNYNQKV